MSIRSNRLSEAVLPRTNDLHFEKKRNFHLTITSLMSHRPDIPTNKVFGSRKGFEWGLETIGMAIVLIDHVTQLLQKKRRSPDPFTAMKKYSILHRHVILVEKILE